MENSRKNIVEERRNSKPLLITLTRELFRLRVTLLSSFGDNGSTKNDCVFNVQFKDWHVFGEASSCIKSTKFSAIEQKVIEIITGNLGIYYASITISFKI